MVDRGIGPEEKTVLVRGHLRFRYGKWEVIGRPPFRKAFQVAGPRAPATE